MFYTRDIGGKANLQYKRFICDALTDLQQIDTAAVPICSEAFVIEEKHTYILNTNKQWKIKE